MKKFLPGKFLGPVNSGFMILLLIMIFSASIYAQNYSHESQLRSGDRETSDRFGHSVSILEYMALIGAPGEAGDGNDFPNQGSAYFFKYGYGGWTESQMVKGSDLAGLSDHNFGSSVALYENTAIIGAPGNNIDEGGELVDGKVYVFENDGSNWNEVQIILPTLDSTLFGNAVDIDGDLVVIGAPGTSGVDTGAVYIYQRFGNMFELLSRIVPTDLDLAGGFGFDVEVSGDHIVVGTRNHGAYIYGYNDTTWVEEARIINDSYGWSLSGSAVAINGQRVLVGRSSIENVSHVGLFEYNGSAWIEAYLLNHIEYGGEYDSYGSAVALSDYMAIVGNYSSGGNGDDWFWQGQIHTYSYTDGGWYGDVIYQGAIDYTEDANQYFGYSVDIYGEAVIGGAPLADDWTGRTYIHELSTRPTEVEVSNGAYKNRNKITWNNDTGQNIIGFKVFRDGVLIDSTVAGAVAYYDYEGIPGKIHAYGVAAYGVDGPYGIENGMSLPNYSLGWQLPNGILEGSVKTPYGAGVDSVEIQLNTGDIVFNSSLEFEGSDDYLIKTDYQRFPTSNLTFSCWMKTSDTENQGTPVSYATTANTNSFYLIDAANFRIGINGEETGPTNISANDGEWHHIAVTWQSSDGEVNLLKDGQIVFTGMLQDGYSIPEDGCLVLGQEQDDFGGGFDSGQAFTGMLDEVRIWNTVRTAEEIEEDMLVKLKGNESNLTSYWTFDDLPDRCEDGYAGDYAKNSGNHLAINGAIYSEDVSPAHIRLFTDAYGSYSQDNIFYGESAQLDLTPVKSGHGFDPAQKTIVMDIESPEYEAENFIDTTAITVSGSIQYAGTICAMSEVEIYLDDEPTGIFADQDGAFALTFDQPGYHKLMPVYGDSTFAHTFLPAEMNLNIEGNIFGLEFVDVTTHQLSGKFGGPCGADIGVARIIISNIGDNEGCYVDTIETDNWGNFNVPLPAQTYILDLYEVDLDNPEISPEFVLQYFTTDTVDLTWEDQEYNFIYRNPPIFRITSWPESGGNGFNVPIVEQEESFIIDIEVLDVWGEDTCYVNEGSITIYDDISGRADEGITIELDNGTAYYQVLPGIPNVLDGGDHPFQKMLQIVGHIGQETIDYTQWAVITGLYPLAETFTTVTPEQVLWVLHDPPGDQSFSFISQDTTLSSFYSHSFESSTGHGGTLDLQIGSIVSMGEWVATEVGGYIFAGVNGMSVTGDGEVEGKILTFTTTQEFSTSANEQIVGASGDVFVGASFNEIFQLTKLIDFDWENNTVLVDTSVAWDIADIATTFLYTESHIRETLLPQLRMLLNLAIQENNQEKITEYTNAINNWQHELALNTRIIQDAEVERNISFSAGATATYTQTSSTQMDTTWTNQTSWDINWEVGYGWVALGCNSEIGYQGFYEQSSSDDTTHTTQTTTTTGYTFSDDDPGDFFSVTVKKDPRGTPAFELFAGTSSCPWEDGTQPRDGVQMMIDTYEQNNIPPDEQAPFILSLGNTSQSGEEREYWLSPIQSSNLDGAIIRVGGVVIEDHLSYTIPAGEQLTATMSVERGPIAYDYENIKLKFYSPCDEESIADTLTFSVHYISPCSHVNLFMPENNWVLNQEDNDTLQFTLTDYDINNQHLEEIRLQYRRIGENWSTAYIFPRVELPEDYINRYWDVSDLPDGNYEIRAASDCGQFGISYSPIAVGIIDRQALMVFGSPQPSDGILNIGEDITIAFSGEIDVSSVNAGQNIKLMNMEDSSYIGIETSLFENTLFVNTIEEISTYENLTLKATVSGIKDIHGNKLRGTVEWFFRVSQNPVYWTVSNVNQTVYQGSEENIVRTLKNAGGEEQSFTITQYPAWLNPSPVNGNIPAEGEQQITLSIDSQLNPGTYHDTVFVATTHGDEPLIVNLEVLVEPPAWSVNAAAYTYSMNITAQIAFEELLSEDDFDIVSAYSGDEIRGIANIEYVPAVGKYLAFLTIYSNQTSGEMLTFRMWDASMGREFASIGGGYTFENNAAMGNASNPVLIESDASVQSINLNQGWSWVSLNVEPADLSVQSAFADIIPSNGDFIKSQTAFSQYVEGYGWVGNLYNLEIGKSYLINSTVDAAMRNTGNPVDVETTTIPVESGWNWIGYYHQEILDINDALATMPASAGDRIKSQTEFAEYISATGTWEGSLDKLNPGQGYLLKSNTGGDLEYPAFNKSGNETSILSYSEKPDWSVNVKDYEYSMSYTAVFEFDEQELRDTSVIISAFAGDDCRGVSKLQYISELEKHIAFLLVYGNNADGDTLSFKIYQPEEDLTRQVEETSIFISDQINGNLESPYVFTALPIGDELVPYSFYLNQNYPNPFNPETTIEYGLPTDQKVKLQIFNILGQKIKTLVNERQEAGRYKIIFNATKPTLPNGVYFYYLKTGDYKKTRKMLILK